MKINLTSKERSQAIIFGLTASKELAKLVSQKTGIKYGELKLERFADKETLVRIKSSVRARHVFVIQSTSNPANENLMELLIFLDAAKRASSGEVTVIIPYYGYARQDRKSKGRQPITSKLVADLLTVAGANRIVSFDIHSDQSQGFFNIPFDHLKAQGPIADFFKKNVKYDKENLVIVSPDHGGVSRARAFAKRFNSSLAVIDKRRKGPNQIESMTLLGDVKNKDVILLDDIIDTAGTMIEAVSLLKHKGAKKIFAVATHGVFSIDKNYKKALDKLEEVNFEKIIITNSIHQTSKTKNLLIVDLSEVLADIIMLHMKNKSIAEYFDKRWS